MAKLLLLSAVGATFLYFARASAPEAPIARLQRADDLRFGELCRKAAA
ncbi:hypothetical protein ACFWNT_27750 [Streptomyces sp. NPDC058409]